MDRKNLIIFTLLALLLAFTDAHAVNHKQPTVILNGPWKFKTGDSLQWAAPDFNDAGWETVDLTAPPGSHDGDVGLTGYVPGWAARGHADYSGYAWYRLKVSLDSLKGNSLALAGPPAVDEAYQLFVDGRLLGSAGDFSGPVPVAYSIQPRMFGLPDSISNRKVITIAFRVWVSAATLSQGTDLGGIHIAPELGKKSDIEARYKFRWRQTIKGYIVEVAEFATFILLAVTIALLRKPVKQHTWFIIALVLLGLVRANQAFYYWLQAETSHQIDIITLVILMPLVLGSWLMAWRDWYRVERPVWIPPVILALTLVYMCGQLFSLPWVSDTVPHAVFQAISNYSRLLFALVLAIIIGVGVRQQGKQGWLYLPAVLLISTGLFAQELSELHIQGIWFPFGVGVSRTQYAYAAFSAVMFGLLVYQQGRKKIPQERH
ncbi:glycoside hydrolase [Mucilaginibacter ginsenosidivorans]|uniref:Glycoside hydrolase n=1 Tax=Mucilaginibacter ginsenosidivorans TaxID=398053 RepID=A0A5B8UXR7_9SPHI|nr:glycoside hydrolase [Mucilaginibacter ginsenosidivorans]QEC63708.1 glycoside hydrolase [Mucilaginibacter ginsenosidivorans]